MDTFPLMHSFLQRNRAGIARKKIAAFARTIVNAWENRSYDHRVNGEGRVLEITGPGHRVIFDVGANVGTWTALARRTAPAAEVHSFEIVPTTAQRLRDAFKDDPKVRVNAFGLGEMARPIEIRHYPGSPRSSSAFGGTMGEPSVPVQSRVVRGDEYLAEHGIGAVDFLKVDAEGMDGFVLKGFQEALTRRSVRMIQFEYGRPNVASRFLLGDFHGLLESHGYVVGKIFPNGVEFRGYDIHDEDFEGPNFLAIDAREAALIRRLAGRKG